MADSDNFLCSLGWHAAPRFPRWNDGYYFATCRRCRRDIVRTAYAGWHVPHGHRIVWQHEPPNRSAAPAMFDSDETAALIEEPVDGPPAPEDGGVVTPEASTASVEDEAAAETDATVASGEDAGASLPDVHDQMDEDKQGNDRGGFTAQTAPQRRSLVPDFMDDPWPMTEAATIARQPIKTDRSEQAERDATDWRAGLDRIGLGSLGRLANRRPLGDTGSDTEDDDRRDSHRQAALIAIALVLAGAAGFALATRDGVPAPTPSSAVAPPPPVAANSTEAVLPTGENALPPDVAGAGTIAYVSASLLRCREQPDGSARTLARLRRNQRVRVLDVQGPWSALSVRGGERCWAATEHLAPGLR